MDSRRLVTVIGIIPARYASTRLPGKALLNIKGKPLIQYTFENAKKCTALDELVVATDDSRIVDAVHSFGGEAVITSSQCKTGTDRLAEVVSRMEHLNKNGIVVNIQGDEPLIEPHVIQQVVEELKQDGNAHMATAVIPLESEEEARDENVVKCVSDLKGNALYFSRAYLKGACKHLGIYAYRLSFLKIYAGLEPTPLQLKEDLEQLKVLEHGFRIKTAIVTSASIGVDTQEDLKKVEKRLCSQNTSSSQAGSAPR